MKKYIIKYSYLPEPELIHMQDIIYAESEEQAEEEFWTGKGFSEDQQAEIDEIKEQEKYIRCKDCMIIFEEKDIVVKGDKKLCPFL